MSEGAAKLPLPVYYIIAIIGWIIVIIADLIMQPWGPALGVADSPIRWALTYLNVIFGLVLSAIAGIIWFMKHPEWLAPIGKYVKGQEYKPLSPWTLSAMGVMAALYAILGIGWNVGVDLAALVTSISAVYFGPIITFGAVFVGAFIRYLLGGVPWVTPYTILEFALWDASVWAINASIYWSVVRKKKIIKIEEVVKYWIVLIPLMIFIHWFALFIVEGIPRYPWEGVVAKIVISMATWYPTSIVSIIFGVIIGESLYLSTLTRYMLEK
ncbi:MAG: hypothetical protein J7L07_02875 [Candidatus Odinarchaeota archaeon]|nr:hypothetical protein [Candidatus Odinarchaeota archaeon]